jgi:hypothetical protein
MAANAGIWTFTPTDGTAETGTFTLATNPGAGDNGGGGGLPADLVNRTLMINYPGGSGEKFQFTSANAVSYEDGFETGTYTYNQGEGRVTVGLGNGWSYDITLQEDGNANVFFKQTPQDSGSNDAATYTLN